jgi:alpha-glucosidase (family GH31 glycosyl hydrolase)
MTKPPAEMTTSDRRDPTTSSASLHNLYPEAWARLNREAVEEMGEELSKDICFFSRSAAVQSPGISHSFWVGDQMHSWDHLDGLESTVRKETSLFC